MVESSNTICRYCPKLCALRFKRFSLNSKMNMLSQVIGKDLIWADALTEPLVRNRGQCMG